MNTLKVMAYLCKCRIKAVAQYKLAFVVGIVAQWISTLADVIALYIMVTSFRNLNGWTAYEVLFLFGFARLGFCVGSMFSFDVFRYFPGFVSEGGIDDLLTKPMHPLANLVGRNFNAGYFSDFTISIGLIVFSLVMLGIRLAALQMLWLTLCALGAAMINCAAQLYLAFYSIRNIGQSPMTPIYWNLRGYLDYPMSVFCGRSRVMQIIFTVLLPYGFMAFYPSQYFLGKSDFMMFHPIVAYLTPAIGLLALIVIVTYFNRIIRTYRSSGT